LAANTWTGAQKVSGSRFRAEGGDATYTFVTTFPGDSRAEPFRTVCGEKSETITLVSQRPEFITQLVHNTGAEDSSVQAAQQQGDGIQVQPGDVLVDVLHGWYPDGATQADTTGWEAEWAAYFTPASEQPFTGGQSESGRKVYQGAVCTDENRLPMDSQPVPLSGPGKYLSPQITVPEQAGGIWVVETITDRSNPDDPKVIRRGECGLVNESAIVTLPDVPEQPVTPAISTKVAEWSETGKQIADVATLTGPYQKGDRIEFWVKHVPFRNPDAAQDKLECAPVDKDNMDGAKIASTVILNHDIAAGTVETVTSEQFTSETPGCTCIKEIAVRPGGDDTPDETLAEGWFGNPTETTKWVEPQPQPTPQPTGKPRAETGGTIVGGSAIWAIAAGIVGLAALAAGAALVVRRKWQRQ
jgi:hypothetical protein